MKRFPERVVHADWSSSPKARAAVIAEPEALGWRLAPLALARAAALVRQPGTLFAVDAPIGVPQAYAQARGIRSFRALLASLAPDDPFFRPVAPPACPSLARPFYPARAGGASRARLLAGLGFSHASALMRECDRRAGAHPLFWTLGPGQCGKAALALWRELLLPELPTLALWPFDGRLAELLATGRPVVVETYPTLARRLLKLPRMSKRNPYLRAALAPALKARAHELGAVFDPELAAELEGGFPRTGEHGFDALLGCLLVLAVLARQVPGGEPDREAARGVEGWMLGLPP